MWICTSAISENELDRVAPKSVLISKRVHPPGFPSKSLIEPVSLHNCTHIILKASLNFSANGRGDASMIQMASTTGDLSFGTWTL
jgi:hypothetical protein